MQRYSLEILPNTFAGMAWHHCDSPLPRNDLQQMAVRLLLWSQTWAHVYSTHRMASCCLYTYTTFCTWQMTLSSQGGRNLTCFPCLSFPPTNSAAVLWRKVMRPSESAALSLYWLQQSHTCDWRKRGYLGTPSVFAHVDIFRLISFLLFSSHIKYCESSLSLSVHSFFLE